MRRRFQAVAVQPARIDLAPLVDVVFLLLIFFILTASFLRESGIAIERPRHGGSVEIDGRLLAVTIARDGTVFADGDPLAALDVEVFRRALARPGRDGQVLIRADAAVSSGLLLRVMDLCERAGARSVQVAAERPR